MDRLRTSLNERINIRLRTVRGGRWADRCRPTWIAFLLTERCNARCVHCDIWTNKGREESPTAEQWKAALSDIRRWLGPVHVCLTGGEALLMPFTPEVVAHGAAIGLRVEVLTHGYWGDQARIEMLARANPWRITLSLDGVGDVHDIVRGRDGFFRRTAGTIENLRRLRREENLGYVIRLKTVVMSHNQGELEKVARFAEENDADVLYQPIEKNYNTGPDPEWYLHTDNWPADPQQTAAEIGGLVELKAAGLPIGNTVPNLREMQHYFRTIATGDPGVHELTASARRSGCSALHLMQVQSNGDVTVCVNSSPVGNIKRNTPREIWENRPQWWESGCCRG